MRIDSINRVHLGRHCRTPWVRLCPLPHPTDRVRRCPHCRAVVYQLLGLDPEAALALINATERRQPGDLYIRRDGTVSTSDRPCGRVGWRLWPFGRLLARRGAA